MGFSSKAFSQAIFERPFIGKLAFDGNSCSEPILQAVQEVSIIVVGVGGDESPPSRLHIIDVVSVVSGAILVDLVSNAVPQPLRILADEGRGEFPVLREDMGARGVLIRTQDRVFKRMLHLRCFE